MSKEATDAAMDVVHAAERYLVARSTDDDPEGYSAAVDEIERAVGVWEKFAASVQPDAMEVVNAATDFWRFEVARGPADPEGLMQVLDALVAAVDKRRQGINELRGQ